MLIWKYQIPPSKLMDGVLQYVEMPRNAVILSCGIQHGLLTLWVDVTDDSTADGYALRGIAVVPTGQQIDKIGRFVGRVEWIGVGLVFHVFDLGNI